MTEENQDHESTKIRLNLPTYFNRKQDDNIWEELELYLFQGFLTVRASLLDNDFVFKTLNHNEIRSIKHLQPLRIENENQRQIHRTAFIAYSVFMVSSENALFDRPRHLRRLIKTISRIPEKIQDEIILKLAVLNERASRLHPLVEIYCQESRSRFKWMHSQDSSIHSSQNTGISGTENLGMSYSQQMWTSVNRLIDKRELMDREWINAKFVGSCFNSKGVRSIDDKDKSRAERERNEREDKRMQVLHNYLNRESSKTDTLPKNIHKMPDGRTAIIEKRFKAETHEELQKELEAALNNEKDWHDEIVNQELARLNKRTEEMEKHQSEWLQAPIMEEMSDIVAAGGGSRVLASKQKAEEYVRRMRQMKNDHIEKTRERLGAGQEPSDEIEE